ncbi:hypothetical protein ALP75_201070 [Pseudomonas syringae pv. actinidiae]|nr:hypothetical protein ALP75_201070 [Pseudomonas syringae pv. actinidiae]
MQFAAEQLFFEQGVFTDIGRNHFADLSVLQQDAQPETVDTAIVGNDGQALDAHTLDLRYQVFRDAAQAKAAAEHRHVVGQPGEGLFVGRYSFVESSHDDPPFIVVDRQSRRRRMA